MKSLLLILALALTTTAQTFPRWPDNQTVKVFPMSFNMLPRISIYDMMNISTASLKLLGNDGWADAFSRKGTDSSYFILGQLRHSNSLTSQAHFAAFGDHVIHIVLLSAQK